MNIYEKIQDRSWSGKKFSGLVRRNGIPEYAGGPFFPGIREHQAGECPYHIEPLELHIADTIDKAIELSERYELNDRRHEALVLAATWHDVGKMVTRAPKERWVCEVCGRSHRDDGSCKTESCPGELDHRMVIGYHVHAEVGGSDWMWGNIAIREGVQPPMKGHVGRLISLHSSVHERIIDQKHISMLNPLGVLLAWADEVSRVSAIFERDNPRRKPEVFESAFNVAVEGHRLRG